MTMIDLAALGSLFFEASKEWRDPKVIRIDPLDSIEQEQVVRDLKAKRHELQWANAIRLRQLAHNGWKPVFERDRIGRPSIFMDRLEELILVHRPPKNLSS
jgi:hypothetical protein